MEYLKHIFTLLKCTTEKATQQIEALKAVETLNMLTGTFVGCLNSQLHSPVFCKVKHVPKFVDELHKSSFARWSKRHIKIRLVPRTGWVLCRFGD